MTGRTHRSRWAVYLTALLLVFVAGVALWNAVSSFGRPTACILVDPDGTVSNAGRCRERPHPEIRFPDSIVEIDGEDITRPRAGEYRARAFIRRSSEQ